MSGQPDGTGTALPAPPPKLAVGIAAAVVVGAIALILLVGRISYPEFPPLADDPQPQIAGQVAWLSWQDDEACVWLVDASGGRPRTVRCASSLSGPVSWSSDGLIQVVDHRARNGALLMLDPADGQVVRRVALEHDDPRRLNPGRETPAGNAVLVEGRAGHMRLIEIKANGQERQVAEAKGPRDYSWWMAQVSPDGGYALVQDSGDRLLVVRLSDGMIWLLAEDGGEAVWGNASGDNAR